MYTMHFCVCMCVCALEHMCVAYTHTHINIHMITEINIFYQKNAKRNADHRGLNPEVSQANTRLY